MLPLGLSMLWEPLDPDEMLRARFGFDDFAAAAEWTATALATTWGITVHGCSRLVISDDNAIVWVRSDEGDLVVKWSRDGERFAGLDASTRLLGALARRGLPVARPFATGDGRERVIVGGPVGPLSVAVIPELRGTWLDVDDDGAVHAAGACLAALHHGLAAGGDDGSPHPSPAAALDGRIRDWLAHHDAGLAPHASREIAGLLAAAPELDDRPQLVHNDFRAANILMRDSAVVGVLDFDEVVVDHRVHDLARAIVYLGTRFTDWRPTPVAARRALRAGYESVRPLAPPESQWLDLLVRWHAVQAIPQGASWAAAL